MLCSIEECTLPGKAKGLCNTHYMRVWRYGNPTVLKQPKIRGTLYERVFFDLPAGDGCWEWTRARDLAGYGQLRVGSRLERVHRLAWELTYGPIPAGLDVLHHCDNPPCRRPDHLFLGTAVENSQDMWNKGRHPIVSMAGSRNGNSRLTEPQVIELRQLWADGGQTKMALARRYGISHRLVRNILTGKTWTHI